MLQLQMLQLPMLQLPLQVMLQRPQKVKRNPKKEPMEKTVKMKLFMASMIGSLGTGRSGKCSKFN